MQKWQIISLHAQLFTLKAHRACKFKYLQAHHQFYRHELHYWPLIQTTKTQSMMMYQILCGHVNYALGKTTGARGTDLSPPFSNFLFTNLFSIKFLYFFIISPLFFPYFNLFVSIFIQSYVNIKLNVSSLSTLYRY